MADLPALWDAATQLARDPVAQTRLLDAAWKLVLLLGLGLLVEGLVVRALGGCAAGWTSPPPRRMNTGPG